MADKARERRLSFFDGLFIFTVSLVFALILCGAFKMAGRFVANFLIGIFGLSIYGFVFASMLAGILKFFNFKIAVGSLKFIHLFAIFSLVILIAHTVTTQTTVGFINASESFVENYKTYLAQSYKMPITAGGIIASSVVYPLLKIAPIAQYFLLAVVLLFLVIAYIVKMFTNISLHRFAKSGKRRDTDKIIVGDNLNNTDIQGRELDDRIKKSIFSKNAANYIPIEDYEKTLNDKDNKKVQEENISNTDVLTNTNNKETRSELDDLSTLYHDPRAGNLEQISSKSRSYDILFSGTQNERIKKANSSKDEWENEISSDSALEILYGPSKVDNKNTKNANNKSTKTHKDDVDDIFAFNKKKVTEKIESSIKEKNRKKEDELNQKLLSTFITEDRMKEARINREKRLEQVVKNNGFDSFTKVPLNPKEYVINTADNKVSNTELINDSDEDDFAIDTRVGINSVNTGILNDIREKTITLEKEVDHVNSLDRTIQVANLNKIKIVKDTGEKDIIDEAKFNGDNSFDSIIASNKNDMYAQVDLNNYCTEENPGRKSRSDKGQNHFSSKREEREIENRFAPIVLNKNSKDEESEKIVEKINPMDKVIKYSGYRKPPIDLLQDRDESITEEVNTEVQDAIVKTLGSFDIQAEVTNVVVGPTFTRFEIDIPFDVPIQKVTQREKDLQLRLGVESMILQAPIPGKNKIGIEIPNRKRGLVNLKGVIESKDFKNSDTKLASIIGKDIDGKVYITDLTKMPHLLVAGATGAGKSVGINSIILGMLYKYGPDYLRFIMIDPKKVELTPYNNIPHMLIPEAITDTQKAINALRWTVDEMERRYQLFLGARCQNISQYNQQLLNKESTDVQKLPYIVVIFDEFGDVMASGNQNKAEVNNLVVRLGQKARAAGIHLILATQRPSVDVITGSIKANLPGRIAFTTVSFEDSKTILGCSGAEKLLRKGDLLFLDSEKANLSRVQGTLVDNIEINAVTDYIRENNKTYFDDELTDMILTSKDERTAVDMKKDSIKEDDVDERANKKYAEVLKHCIDIDKASVSDLQISFGFGYNKAKKYMQSFTANGYVEENVTNSNKGSKVIITEAEFNELFKNILDKED